MASVCRALGAAWASSPSAGARALRRPRMVSPRPPCSLLARAKSSSVAAAARRRAVDAVGAGGDIAPAPATSSRPRLADLRRRLEGDAPASPLQFAAVPAASVDGANVDGGAAAGDTFRRVRAQIAAARAAHPGLDLSDARSEAVLQDTFGRQHNYLRISLSERCNLRCTYCMPEEGVPLQASDQLLSRAEIVRLAAVFAEAGVDKIRLTGGEPTLRGDLLDIVRDLASLPGIREVGMTTNAVKLSRRAQAELRDAGLTAVNISLDTLVDAKFAQITRRSPKILGRVLTAIEESTEFFPGRVKVNCVVMKGFNDGELQDFVRLGRHTPVDIRFIEWMPFSGNRWDERFMSYTEMQAALAGDSIYATHAHPGFVLRRDSDGPNDTTKWWRATAVAGNGTGDVAAAAAAADQYLGRVGFITSMSSNFCGTCNRLRLMADGKIKACLFGEHELSLRDALREPSTTPEELRLLIHSAVARKRFALGGHGDMHGIAASAGNRPMTLIGG